MLNVISGLLTSGAAADLGQFESIQTYTLTGSTADVTFSSIPSTYKHLQIRGIILNSTASDNLAMRLNGDTGANYASHQLQGNGAAASAGASSSQTAAYLSGLVISSGTYPFAFVYDILDYANTSKNKTIRGLSGQDGNASGTATDWRLQLTSGLWASTSAVNSVKIYLPAGNIGNYTSIALYGIKG